ncbi:alcohol dehydrogenase family protein [Pontiellaceae bacterium B12219]|nr:alcohol dehydrogenase family protein [Pontiellaceae bacterium B12219]
MKSINKTMRGVQLIGHGGTEQLILNENLSVPSPDSTDVLVKVAAAGVNNTDINTRIGWYSKSDGDASDATWTGSELTFPRIQGADVCGHIVAVGDLVDSSRLGERVLIEPCLTEIAGNELSTPGYFGSECDGGFAEYTVVASRHAYRVECDLTDVELATFPCSYSTAENMLTRAHVKSTDTVLITGASGGVGSAALQLAKARGAYVIAVTSQKKAKLIADLGADEVVFRNDDLLEKPGRERVDVVIDLVAGKQWPNLLEVLRSKGRYAVSGAIGGPFVELDIRTLYLKDLSFFGCTILEQEVFGNLVQLIEQGRISPLVDHVFPLEQIAEAQTLFLEKKHIGKMVLTL